MAEAIRSIFLGVLQGLTEFLPVSSSGHLVIAQKALGASGGIVKVAAALHLGTAIALLVYFFKDILAVLKSIKTARNIAVTTLATGVVAFAGKQFFESLFNSLVWVSFGLLLTSLVLFRSKKYLYGVKGLKDIGISDSLILGIAQGFAIIPGLSRSGLTIGVLLFLGFSRQGAFRYSFLASIPAVLGAFLLEAGTDALTLSPAMYLGIIAAFFSGLLALKALALMLNKAKLHLFAYYCLALSCAVLIISFSGRH